MKSTEYCPAVNHNRLVGITVMMVLFLLTSCAKKVHFLTSSVVPAARGNVKISKDDNKNYYIHIELLNLSEPERLQPSKKTYVVWMATDRNETTNIGQLNSSSSFFSNQIKASFRTVSSTKPTRIFLTAENDGSIQNPGSQVVLSTKDF